MMVGNEKPGIPWRDRDIRRLRRDIENLKVDPAMLAVHTHASATQGGPVAHTVLTSIGTNTHAQIDTAITASTAHIAATAAHGATGAVVGTTNTQTLSAKTLTTPTIASFVNATHTHADAAGGGQIAHTVLTSIGTNTHAQIDTFMASATATPGASKIVMSGAGSTIAAGWLPIFTSTVAGAVPASGGSASNFLCANVTWTTVKWA